MSTSPHEAHPGGTSPTDSPSAYHAVAGSQAASAATPSGSSASAATTPADPSQRRYLRWYNTVGYGTGDIAGNVVYAFLAFFVMIYLTDTMGMDPAIVSTLMLISKLFDGASDFIFGVLMDKTQTRWGKARPWMFWAFFGCAATIIALFAIPTSMGSTAQYAWFFIAYTLLNSVFYTANNIAYGALTALITKNATERVQMGSVRFVFAFATSLAIQAATIGLVEALGGGAAGWRNVAMLYALIGLASNSLAVFSIRELSPEELSDDERDVPARLPVGQSLRLLLANRYYLIIVVMFIIMQLLGALTGVGIYFMTYVLEDPTLLGAFAWATNIPQMLALLALPFVVEQVGSMRTVALTGYAVAIVARIGIIMGGYMENVPIMLAFTALAMLSIAPLQGSITALIAEASEYTYLRSGVRLDGLMFSCTSLGTKIGGGLGTALTGWLLAAAGYVPSSEGEVVSQPESVFQMLRVMYLWLPLVAVVIIAALVVVLDVEKANKQLRAEK